MIRFIQLFIVVVAAALFANCTAEKEKPPNVILILADDLGAGDLSFAGHPYVKTPNIDQFANSGTTFSRGYMASGWCAPSRYALMTGRYPARQFNKTLNMQPEELTITRLLKDNGYATAHYGKWHMNRDNRLVESPAEFGIDDYFIHNGPGEAWTKEDRATPHWRENTTEFYIDKAIEFIEGRADKPFYMNLWLYPTHSYIDPTEAMLQPYQNLEVDINDFENEQHKDFLKFLSRYGDINKSMQAYCADVTSLDNAVGRLMDYLEKSGLSENTLVVFSSDNGPGPLTGQVTDTSVLIGRYEERPTLLNSVGSPAEFRDRKSSLHDGGTHVPWIVKWPKALKANNMDNETIVHGIDWLPTIATIANIKLEGSFDGMDLSSAYQGVPLERDDPVFWELRNSYAVLEGNLKGVLKHQTFELYDISIDPSESNDLSKERMEDASRIRTMIDEWRSSIAQ